MIYLWLIYVIKTKLFKISKSGNHPITAQYEYADREYKKLHFHQQIQITYVKKGNGILILGNSSVDFKSDTLFIIGENVSHVFIGEKNVLIETISIYFDPKWLKNVYEDNNFILHLIKQSLKGIKIEKFKNLQLIEEVLNKSGIKKIIHFFELLEKIGQATNKQTITNFHSQIEYNHIDSDRLNHVFKHLTTHFTQEIKLEEVAALANMTSPSFCRYFKQRTNKTLSQFVMELRINYACRLLIESDLTILEVSFKCGYNSFSNFLNQFKKIKNQKPKEYKNQHLNYLNHE